MAKKPMGNQVDFNKLRKRRQRATIVKRLLAVGLVTAALGGIILLNNILVEESVTTRISDLVGGMGGSGYPVPLPGGIIRDMKDVDGNLAILNDTNLYIFNPKGKQVSNVQEMSDTTVLLSGAGRMLSYDVGSKRYSIHSKTKTLLDKNTDFSVITAGMNQRGDYAVVSSSKQSICEINVYNKQLKQIFTCYFAENLVGSVSISPKGTMMAAGWVNGQNGVISSGVELFQFSNEEGSIANLKLPDNLVLEVRYLEEDRIGVLTDKQYLVMDSRGTVKYSYSLGGKQISAFETTGRQVLLLSENKENRSRELILLDGECKEKAALATRDKIVDMAMSAKRIYILTDDHIFTYNQKLEQQESFPVHVARRICLVANKLYYLTRDEICVLGQDKDESSVSVSGGEAEQTEQNTDESSVSDSETQSASQSSAHSGEDSAANSSAEQSPAESRESSSILTEDGGVSSEQESR